MIPAGIPVDPPGLRDMESELAKLRRWVDDLQSGMYINCVYCGHRYGPREDTPVAMADVLKEHIESCPKHPLSHALAENERLQAINERLQAIVDKRPKMADGVPIDFSETADD